jgi:hypothetical protein
VTASDGREYNRERLKARPMDLVYSLLGMIRAHEKSDTKSKRMEAAIRRQCQGWISGTWRAPIRVGKDPHWVREIEAGGFELAGDRAVAVRLVIEMFKQGHGAVRIVRELAERGLKITDRGRSATSHIYRLLANRMLIGEKAVEVDGETFRLVTGALLGDDGEAPAAVLRRVRELPNQLASERHYVDSFEHHLAASASNVAPAAADPWRELANGVEQLDYDTRMLARQLVADTFSTIVAYQSGFQPNSESDSIGLTLIAKRGNTRMLIVDRKTGEWRAAEEHNLAVSASRSWPDLKTRSARGC